MRNIDDSIVFFERLSEKARPREAAKIRRQIRALELIRDYEENGGH